MGNSVYTARSAASELAIARPTVRQAEAAFVRCDLRGADFSKARMAGVAFTGVGLSEVTELETVEHAFESSIGVDTLQRSQEQIPEFSRNYGVPEILVHYSKSLLNKPEEFYSCFHQLQSPGQILRRTADGKKLRGQKCVRNKMASQSHRGIYLVPKRREARKRLTHFRAICELSNGCTIVDFQCL